MIGELPHINRGGIGVHVMYLSKLLSKYLDNLTLISSGNQSKVLIKGNLRMIYVKTYPKFDLRSIQQNWLELRVAQKIIKDFDVLHSHNTFSMFNFLIKNKIPLVTTVHGYMFKQRFYFNNSNICNILKHISKYIDLKTLKDSDAIIAVGKTLRQWIIEELRVDPEKVFYIPNGIDPDVFRPIPPEDNPLKDKIKGYPILIFTKHFSPRYGAKDLILAFKDVLDKYPDAKLIMLGKDEWESEIIDYSKKLGVFKKILFPGRVPNEKVPYFLSISDIFINPTSITETFGISVIEAMACETPVVATAVGGPKEIMDEGIRQMGNPVGILVPPKSPSDLAKAILELIENYEEGKRMAKRAREYVLKNYTWDIVAKRTLEVYRYAIEKHKKS